MATITGILSLVIGAFLSLGGWLWGFPSIPHSLAWLLVPHGAFVSFVLGGSNIFSIVMLLLSFPVGFLALAGGIQALRKKIWGLVFASSVAVLLLLPLPGILIILLTILSKKEFK
ncbi:MAG: hypothetical protein HYY41_02340 [Chloroflexi bacterium]|nr:hypothetical protein [Chloroflexota bacterium]